MTTTNGATLTEFLQRVRADPNGAHCVASVHIGESLGLYRALNEGGPQNASQLACSTGLPPGEVWEWALQQAVLHYLAFDHETLYFSLLPDHALLLGDEEDAVLSERERFPGQLRRWARTILQGACGRAAKVASFSLSWRQSRNAPDRTRYFSRA